MWILLAFLSALFAALVAVLAKLGLKNVDPTLATTVRSTIMAVFLIGVSIVFRKFSGFSPASFSQKDWILIILSGIAGALSWLCYFAAIKMGVTTAVVAIDKLSVVMVVVLAVLFLGESLSWKLAVGAVLMTVGAMLISWK